MAGPSAAHLSAQNNKCHGVQPIVEAVVGDAGRLGRGIDLLQHEGFSEMWLELARSGNGCERIGVLEVV